MLSMTRVSVHCILKICILTWIFLYLRGQEYVESYVNTLWCISCFVTVLPLFSNDLYNKKTCTKL
jgi:hypothetical protein